MLQTIGALLTVSVVLMSTACGPKADVVPGVTKAGIRSIRLGMSEHEVRGVLGAPLAVKVGTANQSDRVLEYTKKVEGASHPMLWVTLREGRVRLVYAKKYSWWDRNDEAIYLLNDQTPVPWQTREFEEMFPR